MKEVKSDKAVKLDFAEDLQTLSPSPSNNNNDGGGDDEDDDAKPPALPIIPPARTLKSSWTEYTDLDSNTPYWVNDETGESTWQRP